MQLNRVLAAETHRIEAPPMDSNKREWYRV